MFIVKLSHNKFSNLYSFVLYNEKVNRYIDLIPKDLTIKIVGERENLYLRVNIPISHDIFPRNHKLMNRIATIKLFYVYNVEIE